MKITFKDKAIEFRKTKPFAPLSEMPGFRDWVYRSLLRLVGNSLTCNGFNHGMNIAGQNYGTCRYQGSTVAYATLNENGTVSIFADEEFQGKFPISEEELIPLIAKRIGSSWHPHCKQWEDVYNYEW